MCSLVVRRLVMILMWRWISIVICDGLNCTELFSLGVGLLWRHYGMTKLPVLARMRLEVSCSGLYFRLVSPSTKLFDFLSCVKCWRSLFPLMSCVGHATFCDSISFLRIHRANLWLCVLPSTTCASNRRFLWRHYWLRSILYDTTNNFLVAIWIANN